MNRNKELIYRVVGDPIEIIKKVGDYLYGIGELNYELYLFHFASLNEYSANPHIKEWFVGYIKHWGLEMDYTTNELGATEYQLFR